MTRRTPRRRCSWFRADRVCWRSVRPPRWREVRGRSSPARARIPRQSGRSRPRWSPDRRLIHPEPVAKSGGRGGLLGGSPEEVSRSRRGSRWCVHVRSLGRRPHNLHPSVPHGRRTYRATGWSRWPRGPGVKSRSPSGRNRPRRGTRRAAHRSCLAPWGRRRNSHPPPNGLPGHP